MPIKKSNLDSDVKSKLRRAVLSEIGTDDQNDDLSELPAFNDFKVKKPSKKILKKTVAKPKKNKTTEDKKNSKITKVKNKIPKTASIKSSLPITEAGKKNQLDSSYNFDDKRVAYRPAWERVKRDDSSLEDFFDKSKTIKNKKTEGFLNKFFTKTSTKELIPTKSIKPAGFFSGLLKILGLVVLLLVLLLAFDIFGVYRLGFKDQVSLNIVKYLPLPAGQVNGRMIAATTYLDDLKSLSLPLSEKREGLINYTGSTEIKDKVFYRLAANQLVEEKLKAYNNDIDATAINSQVELLVSQAGSRDQAEKIIRDLYGLNLDQFTAKIIIPMMRRENLQSAIVNDQSLAINLEAQKLAEDVLKQARASSSDFNLLAKKYTQDEVGVNTGGELGWVVKGQLDPQWEPLIFNASSSMVLPQLVKSRFGYHIIKVEQKLVDSTTKQESVKIKHILIKVDVDEYIKGLLDTANLVKYIK